MSIQLDVRDLSLSFGGVQALRDVTLSIPLNEVTGLIGPNGAGKTSLFNCISRLYEPTSGEILLDGESLLSVATDQIIERGIARTFQNLSLCRSMTVRQNVVLGAHHRMTAGLWGSILRGARVRREEAEFVRQVDEILEATGLTSYGDTLVDDLSYGTLKRVEIARGLASAPRLLLLDEPAGGLSHGEVDELAELIVGLRDRFGVGMLLIEHHMGFVMKICERIHCLDFGELIASGTPRQMQADPRVVEAYLGTPA